jgi:hypothetical protein
MTKIQMQDTIDVHAVGNLTPRSFYVDCEHLQMNIFVQKTLLAH